MLDFISHHAYILSLKLFTISHVMKNHGEKLINEDVAETKCFGVVDVFQLSNISSIKHYEYF